MQITGTHIAYLHTCHRKLWLFGNGIHMEHTSETVAEGKLIGESSYARRPEHYTEIQVEGVKIDFFDPELKVVHEIKKSKKMEQAHIAQVKYYIFVLEEHGLNGVTGLLEYPKLKRKMDVSLDNDDRNLIPQWIEKAQSIIESKKCPPLINKPICKSCSYFDFCYISEEKEAQNKNSDTW